MKRMPCPRALLVAASLCLACGGDDDDATDGGPGSDGSPAGDDGGRGGPDAATSRRVGDSVAFFQREVSAQIRFSEDREGPGSCLSEQVAGCEIQTCKPAGAPATRPDAGVVSVTAPGGGQSYLPDDGGFYPAGPGPQWEAGDEVVVAADGGEVPAFDLTLTGPGDITAVVEPDLAQPIVVARDAPLAVEWTGVEAFGGIAIRCPAADEAGESVQVRCMFDGTGGEAPVAALERLPACTATVYVYTEHRQVVARAPDWLIRVGLRGVLHPGTATIQ